MMFESQRGPHPDKPLLLTDTSSFLEGAATEVLQQSLGIARPDYIDFLVSLYRDTLTIERARPHHPADGHNINSCVEAYAVGEQTELFNGCSITRSEFLAAAGNAILISDVVQVPLFSDLRELFKENSQVQVRKLGAVFFSKASEVIQEIDRQRANFWKEVANRFSLFEYALRLLVEDISRS